MSKTLINFCVLIILLFVKPSSSVASFVPYFDLSLLGDTYFLPVSQDLNNGQLHGRFKLLNSQEDFTTFFDMGAGGLVGEKAESYFIIPQAYVELKKEKLTYTMGRKVKSFSTLDEYWMLGDVQPLFRWDAVHPELQGLTGVFAEWKANKNLDVNFFGSYTFLPTQGPSYSITGGKLTSSNPWFTRPVDVLNLSGNVPYDLQYSINTPKVADVVFRPSGGIGVTLKSDDESLWLRVNHFIKTKNELVLPFQGSLLLDSNTGQIIVQPQAAQHKITSLDLGYRQETWSATLSGIYESDIHYDMDDTIDDPWINPHYSDQYKVGLHLMNRVTPSHTLEFGLLRTFKNWVTIRGIDTGGNLDIYSYRNQYDNAADIRLGSVFIPRPYGFLFKTKMRYAYDYEVNTSLVSLELNYMPLEGLTVFALTDWFGGTRESGKAYNNLLVNYLNKDRAQAGVRYVF